MEPEHDDFPKFGISKIPGGPHFQIPYFFLFLGKLVLRFWENEPLEKDYVFFFESNMFIQFQSFSSSILNLKIKFIREPDERWGGSYEFSRQNSRRILMVSSWDQFH